MMKSESGPKRRTEPTTPGRPTYTYVCSALARRTEPTGPPIQAAVAGQVYTVTMRARLGLSRMGRLAGSWVSSCRPDPSRAPGVPPWADAGQSRAPGRGGPGSEKHEVRRAADPIRASPWRPGPGSGVRRRRAAKVLLTSSVTRDPDASGSSAACNAAGDHRVSVRHQPESLSWLRLGPSRWHGHSATE